MALDPSTHRGEFGKASEKIRGLQGELQGKPASDETWTAIAFEHPEFFRVNQKKKVASLWWLGMSPLKALLQGSGSCQVNSLESFWNWPLICMTVK